MAVPAVQQGPKGVFGAEVGDDGSGVCDGETGADDEERAESRCESMAGGVEFDALFGWRGEG